MNINSLYLYFLFLLVLFLNVNAQTNNIEKDITVWYVGDNYSRKFVTPFTSPNIYMEKAEKDRVEYIFLLYESVNYEITIQPADSDFSKSLESYKHGEINIGQTTEINSGQNITINCNFSIRPDLFSMSEVYILGKKKLIEIQKDKSSFDFTIPKAIKKNQNSSHALSIFIKKGYIPLVVPILCLPDNNKITYESIPRNKNFDFIKENYRITNILCTEDSIKLSWQKYPDDASHFVIALGAASDTIHVRSTGEGEYTHSIPCNRLPKNDLQWNVSITSFPFSFIQDAKETRIDTVITRVVTPEEFLCDLQPIATLPDKQHIFQSSQDSVELNWSYDYAGQEYPKNYLDSLMQIVCIEDPENKKTIKSAYVKLDKNTANTSVSPGEGYMWSVHARWKADTTLVTKSDSSSFFVEDTVSTPMLQKPANNDTLNVEKGISFCWQYEPSPVTRFESRLQISANRNFDPILFDSLASNFFLELRRPALPIALDHFYWRVINADSYGNIKSSVTHSFYLQDSKDLLIANLISPVFYTRYVAIIEKERYKNFVSKLSDTQNFDNQIALGLSHTWREKQSKYMFTTRFSLLSDFGGSLYLEHASRLLKTIHSCLYINFGVYSTLSGYGLKQYSNIQWGANVGVMMLPLIHGNGIFSISYVYNEKPYLNAHNTRSFFRAHGIGFDLSWRIAYIKIFFGGSINVGNDLKVPTLYFGLGYYLH